jgi:hypothetical protein
MPLALRPHQIDDLGFYINNERWMNLSDPGTGKTPSVCVYIEYLAKHKDCITLWSMPKGLLVKNKDELHEFTNLKDDEVIIIDGTPKQRQKQMESPNAKVFLMGFKRFADDWKTLKDLHPKVNCHLIDEVHMGFKTADSQRTKSLFRAMRKLKYFGVMSGTLIDGRLDSCYPTIHIIEPRYYVSHYNFTMQHGIFDENGQIIMWTGHDKIGRIFLRHGIRRTFAEVYGKEDPVIQTDWCEMTPKQQKAYDDFERDAMLELDDYLESIENDVLEGFEPGVKSIRSRQIMAHPETFGIIKEGELTGKDERLVVHLEDHKNNGEPLLIYSVLQPEQDRIYKLCQKMGFRVGLINGTVSAKKRSEIDKAFRKGDLDIVVASPETTAVGYNWRHLNHIIFASIDYKNTNFVQGYRRAIREKRDRALLVTVLGYKCKVERGVFRIVNAKSRLLNKVDSTYEILTIGEEHAQTKEKTKESVEGGIPSIFG